MRCGKGKQGPENAHSIQNVFILHQPCSRAIGFPESLAMHNGPSCYPLPLGCQEGK